MTRYPNSHYIKDATQRMVYLVNTLAGNELHVARYYMKREAYVAAVNRCKYVIENYPHSTSLEEALVIMISAYDLLGMTDLQQDTLRVLKTNYPQSRLLGSAAPSSKNPGGSSGKVSGKPIPTAWRVQVCRTCHAPEHSLRAFNSARCATSRLRMLTIPSRPLLGFSDLA